MSTSLITPPTLDELISQTQSNIYNELPTSNPFLEQNFITAMAIAMAINMKGLYDMLQSAINMLFPFTATGDALDQWAEGAGLTRISATTASGTVIFTGSAGLTIPVGQTMTITSTGITYIVQSTTAIYDNVVSVSSLTRSGTIAYATTSTDHGFTINQSIIIDGADDSSWNGSFTVTSVPSSTTFTFDVTGSETTPATGTITASSEMGSCFVTSTTNGVDTNASAGTALTLDSPLTGIDTTGYVGNTDITGGADDESDTDYLERFTTLIKNPPATFSKSQIESIATSISGVTRTKVYSVEDTGSASQLLFVRDNDDNIIPDSGELLEVSNALVDYTPADKLDSPLFEVIGPTTVTVDFVFDSISPDSTTMRDAILANLTAYFRYDLDIGSQVTSQQYISVISNTIDPSTSYQITDFSLTSPSGDVTISQDELAVLGDITYG